MERLYQPFPPEKVSWRVGATNKDKTKAIALAYIDARDVMERLDEAVGPENWQCRYSHADKKTICEISIYNSKLNCWITKANGAGDSDIEAEKGAISDAFKRAAVLFGVGRYLYDIDSPWVEIEEYGRSYRIKASEMPRLAALLPRPPSGPKPLPKEQARKVQDAITAIAHMDAIERAEWLAVPENMTMVNWLRDNERPEYQDFKALGVE